MKSPLKKTPKTYYTCFLKEEDHVIISTSMSFIANRLGINQVTIRRHLVNSTKYITDKWTIEKNIYIHTIKRGSALHLIRKTNIFK